MADAVEADPVRALMGADRDGLLRYHGAVSGGRYEVDVAGRRRILAGSWAVDGVERLRAIERVGLAAGQARLTDLRDDGTHVVDVAGRQVELPEDQVVDWCAGFVAAHVGDGQEHVGVDQLDEIAAVIKRPDRDDQCRLVILALMYGRGEELRVSSDRLRELIGQLPGVASDPAKKTVLNALTFGESLSTDMAEKMIAAFGLRWKVGVDSGTFGWVPEGSDAAGLVIPEMPGMAALRRIVDASGAGWLRYVDEPSPNKARWKQDRDRWYRLTVGEQEYEIGTDHLNAWLDGVEAYHAG